MIIIGKQKCVKGLFHYEGGGGSCFISSLSGSRYPAFILLSENMVFPLTSCRNIAAAPLCKKIVAVGRTYEITGLIDGLPDWV
jgi:hypothetical protein